jgi:hypothetical protein
VRSSVRPADVVTRQATVAGALTVPPEIHAVTVVVVFVDESRVTPDTVTVCDEIVSPSASHSDQSNVKSKTASGSFVYLVLM